MLRRLIMAIFRLYMKYLLSSYTKHTWAVYMGLGGVKWAGDLVSVRTVGRCGLHKVTDYRAPSSPWLSQ
jgi:hypothetical protein